ncbi:MAG: MurR/RpiR family transcriptional regulator [Rhodospirillum sp.]|nr:MurR/RpiR family transcriptional regulator [Rhodospirillum sp.]MCF8491271.1 MurR/RpiR family transcriptional regulator [Rhodospirillum sp.]MCF8502918.1 MurR/RpiR family transcriptional regulator [Rhodospirillum sp.]
MNESAPSYAEACRRLRDTQGLGPGARRAAAWLLDHPEDVALLSMRRLAEAAGVPPATMTRLAQSLGWGGFEGLRAPFLDRLRNGGEDGDFLVGFRASAAREEADQGGAARAVVRREISALSTLATLEAEAAVARAVEVMSSARRVFCLGVRGSHAPAYVFHYGYQLMRDNAVLVEGGGATFMDCLRGIGPGDVLLAVSERPYARLTVMARDHALAQGAKVVALTDSARSPLAAGAEALVILPRGGGTFFPGLGPALCVVQMLLAHLAARGGEDALTRIKASERQLAAFDAFWHDPSTRTIKE